MKRDNAFIPVLCPEALAAASLHVRTVRSDALTLFFLHTLDAAPSALERDARTVLRDDENTVVLPDGRVHALYAVKLLLGALAHRALQDLAVARMLEVLSEFLPRPLVYEAHLADAVAADMAQWLEEHKGSLDAAKWQGLLPAMERVQALIKRF